MGRGLPPREATGGLLLLLFFLLLAGILPAAHGGYVVTTPRVWRAGTTTHICLQATPTPDWTNVYVEVNTVHPSYPRSSSSSSSSSSPSSSSSFFPSTPYSTTSFSSPYTTVAFYSAISPAPSHLASAQLHLTQDLPCGEVWVPEFVHDTKEAIVSLEGEMVIDGHTISRISSKGRIHVEPQPRTILIATDKTEYWPGDKVHLRLLSLVGLNMAPDETYSFEEVWIENPNGIRAKQWRNVESELGLAHLSFHLANDTQLGKWLFGVKMSGPNTARLGRASSFSVTDAPAPVFLVNIHTLPFIFASDARVDITVCARYPFQHPVTGILNLEIRHGSAQPNASLTTSRNLRISGCTNVTVEGTDFQLGLYNFHYGIYVTATVTEDGTESVQEAQIPLPVTRVPLKITLEGQDHRDPKAFLPGLPFVASALVTFPDDSPAQGEPLLVCEDAVEERCRVGVPDAHGRMTFVVPTAPHQEVLRVKVSSMMHGKSSSGSSGGYGWMFEPGREAIVWRTHSPSTSSLQLLPQPPSLPCTPAITLTLLYATDRAQDANMTVQVISKGQIVHWSLEEIFLESRDLPLRQYLTLEPPESTTETPLAIAPEVTGYYDLQIPIRNDMWPWARVLIFYTRDDGEVVSASTRLEVDYCPEHDVSLKWSTSKSQPRDQVEIELSAFPEALCSVGVSDEGLGGAVNEPVTVAAIRQTMEAKQLSRLSGPRQDEPPCRKDNQEDDDQWSFPTPLPSDLFDPDDLRRRKRSFLPSPPIHVQPSFAFQESGMLVLSDMMIHTLSCEEYQDWWRQHPPGLKQEGPGPIPMADPFLPAATPASPVVSSPGSEESESAIRSNFPDTWIWQLAKVGVSGKEFLAETVPDSITTWAARAVCVHHKVGLGISQLESRHHYDHLHHSEMTMKEDMNPRPYALQVTTPFFLRLDVPSVIKRGEIFPLKVVIFNYMKLKLPIKVILETTRDFEVVSGSWQTSMCVGQEDHAAVDFRVRSRTFGDVTVTVSAMIDHGGGAGCGSREVKDLRKRDTVTRTLKVDPEGILQERTWSQYVCNRVDGEHILEWLLEAPSFAVKDSARAHIALSSDLMSVSLQNLHSLVSLPTACGEQNLIRMAPSLFLLQYLQATGQADNATYRLLKDELASGYQRQLNFLRPDGSFSAFGKDDDFGSTWLTALVVRVFGHARDYIDVDESVLEKGRAWVRRQQREDGCFVDRAKPFTKALLTDEGTLSPVTLTAFVGAALLESNNSPSSQTIQGALQCLSGVSSGFSSITPYTMALTAYMYVRASRLGEAQRLISTLMSRMAYRSSAGITWRDHRMSEAAQVETAGYVLMTLIALSREGRSPSPHGNEEILEVVRGLTTYRKGSGGFVTTQDTIVALQALATFASSSDSSSLPVNTLVSISTEGLEEDLKMTEENRLVHQKINIPILPTDVIVDILGTGCVLVQAHLEYHVAWVSTRRAFKIGYYQEVASDCSSATINICTLYTLDDQTSNMVVLEVGIVSGYEVDKDEMKEMLEANQGVMRFEIQAGKVNFYLTEVSREEQCVSFKKHRRVTVEDALPATISVYDYYRPELTTAASYILDGCQDSTLLDSSYQVTSNEFDISYKRRISSSSSSSSSRSSSSSSVSSSSFYNVGGEGTGTSENSRDNFRGFEETDDHDLDFGEEEYDEDIEEYYDENTEGEGVKEGEEEYEFEEEGSEEPEGKGRHAGYDDQKREENNIDSDDHSSKSSYGRYGHRRHKYEYEERRTFGSRREGGGAVGRGRAGERRGGDGGERRTTEERTEMERKETTRTEGRRGEGDFRRRLINETSSSRTEEERRRIGGRRRWGGERRRGENVRRRGERRRGEGRRTDKSRRIGGEDRRAEEERRREEEEQEEEARRVEEERRREEELRRVEEERRREELQRAEEERRREEESRRLEEQRRKEEASRLEKERREEEERRAEEERKMKEEEARRAEEERIRKEEEARRLEEERRKEEETKRLEEEQRRKEEEARLLEEERRREEARRLEEERIRLEEARRMEEERKRQEEERMAEEKRRKEEESKRMEEKKRLEEEARLIEEERLREEEEMRIKLERAREEEEARRLEEEWRRVEEEEEMRRKEEERRLAGETATTYTEERREETEKIRREQGRRRGGGGGPARGTQIDEAGRIEEKKRISELRRKLREGTLWAEEERRIREEVRSRTGGRSVEDERRVLRILTGLRDGTRRIQFERRIMKEIRRSEERLRSRGGARRGGGAWRAQEEARIRERRRRLEDGSLWLDEERRIREEVRILQAGTRTVEQERRIVIIMAGLEDGTTRTEFERRVREELREAERTLRSYGGRRREGNATRTEEEKTGRERRIEEEELVDEERRAEEEARIRERRRRLEDGSLWLDEERRIREEIRILQTRAGTAEEERRIVIILTGLDDGTTRTEFEKIVREELREAERTLRSHGERRQEGNATRTGEERTGGEGRLEEVDIIDEERRAEEEARIRERRRQLEDGSLWLEEERRIREEIRILQTGTRTVEIERRIVIVLAGLDDGTTKTEFERRIREELREAERTLRSHGGRRQEGNATRTEEEKTGGERREEDKFIDEEERAEEEARIRERRRRLEDGSLWLDEEGRIREKVRILQTRARTADEEQRIIIILAGLEDGTTRTDFERKVREELREAERTLMSHGGRGWEGNAARTEEERTGGEMKKEEEQGIDERRAEEEARIREKRRRLEDGSLWLDEERRIREKVRILQTRAKTDEQEQRIIIILADLGDGSTRTEFERRIREELKQAERTLKLHEGRRQEGDTTRTEEDRTGRERIEEEGIDEERRAEEEAMIREKRQRLDDGSLWLDEERRIREEVRILQTGTRTVEIERRIVVILAGLDDGTTRTEFERRVREELREAERVLRLHGENLQEGGASRSEEDRTERERERKEQERRDEERRAEEEARIKERRRRLEDGSLWLDEEQRIREEVRILQTGRRTVEIERRIVIILAGLDDGTTKTKFERRVREELREAERTLRSHGGRRQDGNATRTEEERKREEEEWTDEVKRAEEEARITERRRRLEDGSLWLDEERRIREEVRILQVEARTADEEQRIIIILAGLEDGTTRIEFERRVREELKEAERTLRFHGGGRQEGNTARTEEERAVGERRREEEERIDEESLAEEEARIREKRQRLDDGSLWLDEERRIREEIRILRTGTRTVEVERRIVVILAGLDDGTTRTEFERRVREELREAERILRLHEEKLQEGGASRSEEDRTQRERGRKEQERRDEERRAEEEARIKERRRRLEDGSLWLDEERRIREEVRILQTGRRTAEIERRIVIILAGLDDGTTKNKFERRVREELREAEGTLRSHGGRRQDGNATRTEEERKREEEEWTDEVRRAEEEARIRERRRRLEDGSLWLDEERRIREEVRILQVEARTADEEQRIIIILAGLEDGTTRTEFERRVREELKEAERDLRPHGGRRQEGNTTRTEEERAVGERRREEEERIDEESLAEEEARIREKRQRLEDGSLWLDEERRIRKEVHFLQIGTRTDEIERRILIILTGLEDGTLRTEFENRVREELKEAERTLRSHIGGRQEGNATRTEEEKREEEEMIDEERRAKEEARIKERRRRLRDGSLWLDEEQRIREEVRILRSGVRTAEEERRIVIILAGLEDGTTRNEFERRVRLELRKAERALRFHGGRRRGGNASKTEEERAGGERRIGEDELIDEERRAEEEARVREKRRRLEDGSLWLDEERRIREEVRILQTRARTGKQKRRIIIILAGLDDGTTRTEFERRIRKELREVERILRSHGGRRQEENATRTEEEWTEEERGIEEEELVDEERRAEEEARIRERRRRLEDGSLWLDEERRIREEVRILQIEARTADEEQKIIIILAGLEDGTTRTEFERKVRRELKEAERILMSHGGRRGEGNVTKTEEERTAGERGREEEERIDEKRIAEEEARIRERRLRLEDGSLWLDEERRIREEVRILQMETRTPEQERWIVIILRGLDDGTTKTEFERRVREELRKAERTLRSHEGGRQEGNATRTEEENTGGEEKIEEEELIDEERRTEEKARIRESRRRLEDGSLWLDEERRIREEVRILQKRARTGEQQRRIIIILAGLEDGTTRSEFERRVRGELREAERTLRFPGGRWEGNTTRTEEEGPGEGRKKEEDERIDEERRAEEEGRIREKRRQLEDGSLWLDEERRIREELRILRTGTRPGKQERRIIIILAGLEDGTTKTEFERRIREELREAERTLRSHGGRRREGEITREERIDEEEKTEEEGKRRIEMEERIEKTRTEEERRREEEEGRRREEEERRIEEERRREEEERIRVEEERNRVAEGSTDTEEEYEEEEREDGDGSHHEVEEIVEEHLEVHRGEERTTSIPETSTLFSKHENAIPDDDTPKSRVHPKHGHRPGGPRQRVPHGEGQPGGPRRPGKGDPRRRGRFRGRWKGARRRFGPRYPGARRRGQAHRVVNVTRTEHTVHNHGGIYGKPEDRGSENYTSDSYNARVRESGQQGLPTEKTKATSSDTSVTYSTSVMSHETISSSSSASISASKAVTGTDRSVESSDTADRQGSTHGQTQHDRSTPQEEHEDGYDVETHDDDIMDHADVNTYHGEGSRQHSTRHDDETSVGIQHGQVLTRHDDENTHYIDTRTHYEGGAGSQEIHHRGSHHAGHGTSETTRTEVDDQEGTAEEENGESSRTSILHAGSSTDEHSVDSGASRSRYNVEGSGHEEVDIVDLEVNTTQEGDSHVASSGHEGDMSTVDKIGTTRDRTGGRSSSDTVVTVHRRKGYDQGSGVGSKTTKIHTSSVSEEHSRISGTGSRGGRTQGGEGGGDFQGQRGESRRKHKHSWNIEYKLTEVNETGRKEPGDGQGIYEPGIGFYEPGVGFYKPGVGLVPEQEPVGQAVTEPGIGVTYEPGIGVITEPGLNTVTVPSTGGVLMPDEGGVTEPGLTSSGRSRSSSRKTVKGGIKVFRHGSRVASGRHHRHRGRQPQTGTRCGNIFCKNGDCYRSGRCKCHAGWAGRHCNIKEEGASWFKAAKRRNKSQWQTTSPSSYDTISPSSSTTYSSSFSPSSSISSPSASSSSSYSSSVSSSSTYSSSRSGGGSELEGGVSESGDAGDGGRGGRSDGVLQSSSSSSSYKTTTTRRKSWQGWSGSSRHSEASEVNTQASVSQPVPSYEPGIHRSSGGSRRYSSWFNTLPRRCPLCHMSDDPPTFPCSEEDEEDEDLGRRRGHNVVYYGHQEPSGTHVAIVHPLESPSVPVELNLPDGCQCSVISRGSFLLIGGPSPTAWAKNVSRIRVRPRASILEVRDEQHREELMAPCRMKEEMEERRQK